MEKDSQKETWAKDMGFVWKGRKSTANLRQKFLESFMFWALFCYDGPLEMDLSCGSPMSVSFSVMTSQNNTNF